MIEKTFKTFSIESDEGKIMLAALAILTSLTHDDIKSNKYGCCSSPEPVFDIVVDLANQIFFESEWKLDQLGKKRIQKINAIENE